MLVSYRWVSEISGVTASPQELANRLTFSGLEVEGVDAVGELSPKIVVAEIVEKTPHPTRERLSIATVSSGGQTHQVVCGAPNCPGAGGRVVLALPGAELNGTVLASRKLGGVMSEGMLLSEDELGIGPDDDGILILDGETNAAIGTPVKEALDLADWILDVAITPNRPDALSHQGIAREVSLLFEKSYTKPAASDVVSGEEPVESLAKVTILDADLCPRYAAAVITGVKWRPSPFGVRYRLHNLGLRPISNLVDATNLIMLEFGQPIHAFDLDTLKERHIVVRRARTDERMTTLDGIERRFNSDDLLICDTERPVAIAGVMGGDETGISEKSERVLIECAYFNPSAVRRTSKRLKLLTDAAYRFERGMDPNGVPDVLEQTVDTIITLAGGVRAPGIIDCYPTPISAPKLTLRPERYSAVIGCDVPAAKMATVMTGLGAEARIGENGIEVVPPTSRPDIEREIDLIEEVARIRGFEEIPPSTPNTTCMRPMRPYFQAERLAKEILAGLGLNEAISYSFVSGALLTLLQVDQNVVEIANPLNSERSSMRTTLLAGLLENLKRAQSRFLDKFAQFEVARTYHDVGEELPNEVLKAAAVMYGPAHTWVSEPERMMDFFDMKGVLEAFLNAYSGGEGVRLEPATDIGMFHPKRAMRVIFDNTPCGIIGEVHPQILSKLKLHRGVLAFEVSIYDLFKQRSLPAAVPLPEFPPMSRDVALLVHRDQDSGAIIEAFRASIGVLAEEIRVFDEYTGEHIPDDRKSLAFSIVYRSEKKTLTDKEVDAIHKRAVTSVAEQFDAVQR